jgi:hypothetical protein
MTYLHTGSKFAVFQEHTKAQSEILINLDARISLIIVLVNKSIVHVIMTSVRGCRITAIMSAFQVENGSSTLPTRTIR